MSLTLQVVQIVTPVFLMVSVGALWVWSGRDFPTGFVTEFVTKLAVPALIIVVLMRSELEKSAVTQLFLAALAAYGIACSVFAVVLAVFRLPMRTYLAPFTFGNTGNLGLPLALFAFGSAGLELAVVVFAVTSVLAFSVGIGLVSGSFSAKRLLSEPIVWGTVIGAALLYTDTKTPVWIANFLDLLGQLAIPLVLATLGVSLARLNANALSFAFVLSALKLFGSAAIGWGVGLAFGLDPLAASVLILQMATPVAVTSFMLAQLYEAEEGAVAAMVIASTALSIVTLPLLLGILV